MNPVDSHVETNISPFELEGVSPDGTITRYTSTDLVEDSFLVVGVYAWDFSPICTEQLCEISELEWLTVRDDVNVVGLSGDGPYSHRQFIDEYDIGYPLLCDTAAEVLSDLGVLQAEEDGLRQVPRRSMFVIDEAHEIRWRWVADQNWDDWNIGPVSDLDDAITALGA